MRILDQRWSSASRYGLFTAAETPFLINISKVITLTKPISTSYHSLLTNLKMLLVFIFISAVTPFQDQMDDEHDDSKVEMRRKNHTVLERQRRSEQRDLFDKLQAVLQSDPRTPRLRLLSLVSATSCSSHG